VTLFGIFFTPVFYVIVRWFSERKSSAPVGPAKGALAAAGSAAISAASNPDGCVAIQDKPDSGVS
jgi:hypothetical protein